MSSLPLDRSAAMALGIAATAMPFAGSPDAEAERWLRILRMHGEASLILSSLGVTEAASEDFDGQAHEQGAARPAPSEDAVTQVTGEARRAAQARGADAVGTHDLLAAVSEVYGDAFERVLEGHGTSREELRAILELERRPRS